MKRGFTQNNTFPREAVFYLLESLHWSCVALLFEES